MRTSQWICKATAGAAPMKHWAKSRSSRGDEVKIKKDDFDMMHIADRLKAPNAAYATNVILPGDPKELYIAVNEFSYNISKF